MPRITTLVVLVTSLTTFLVLIGTGSGQSQLNYSREFVEKKWIDNAPISTQMNLSNYSLDVILDTEAHNLHGKMLFDYVNNEKVVLDTLYFHLYANASEEENKPGYTLINEVKTADKEQDILYTFGFQLLNVTLPQPIQPNDSISLWIDFETVITNNQSYRLNYFKDPEISHVISLCNFYPILAVFDEKDGWNLEPIYFVGDPFYSDLANYYINITLPSEYMVASSGQLIDQVTVVNQIRYSYQLLSARDFTFALCPDYIRETGSYGGTSIYVYYLPVDSGNWSGSAVDYAKYSLSLFTDLYGPYPYPTYSVASTFGDYGGMEWPGLVYIQSGYQYTEMVIVHETAHQWFYNIVGNDQIDEGFLDEMTVVYSSWYYYEERYDYKEFYPYYAVRAAEKNDPEEFPEGLVVNRSINEIIDTNLDEQYYWETAYRKGPVILHLLRTYIGDENFFNALGDYYTSNYFQIATFRDLIESFNKIVDINWFLPWFNEEFLPDVEILSAEVWRLNDNSGEYKFSLKLRQNGDSYPAKIPFQFNFRDGTKSLIWIWCNSTETTTFTKIFEKQPTSIEVDVTSGYLYTLQLLNMDSFPIENKFTETINFSFPLLFLMLIAFLMRRKRRKYP
ncbi:MAG: M1 family metallopeptidase [Candidatus Heimdallarchaeota archaeon]|nr:MAG: M1 family metallopeptidase [Candidatus Heimdallarchaeota archaeon]